MEERSEKEIRLRRSKAVQKAALISIALATVFYFAVYLACAALLSYAGVHLITLAVTAIAMIIGESAFALFVACLLAFLFTFAVTSVRIHIQKKAVLAERTPPKTPEENHDVF